MTVVMQSLRKRKISNRAQPRERLRQRIADAALSLFKEFGFDAVSVDQIVARAAVSKGTFFNFFPTKIDVLLIYFNEVDQRIAALRTKLDPRKPQAALEKFVARAEAILRAEGSLIETLSRAIWTESALLEADRASAVQDRQAFAGFFQRAQAAGTIDPAADPKVAADAFGDLWTGSILRWLAFERGYSLARTIAPKTQLLFTGLHKRRKS